jgi:hypothetical protein
LFVSCTHEKNLNRPKFCIRSVDVSKPPNLILTALKCFIFLSPCAADNEKNIYDRVGGFVTSITTVFY